MPAGYPLLHGGCMGGGRGWAPPISGKVTGETGVGLHKTCSQAGETGAGAPSAYSFQMSRWYSAMERSEEKKPDLAMFTSIFLAQACRSSYCSSSCSFTRI